MKKNEKIFLFAGDQKFEHLDKNIDAEHLFKIANSAPVDAFATQLGLISYYGGDYKNINYVVKLNSKTNLIKTEQKDPISLLLHSVSDVVQFKKETKLNIIGVGYTIYLGSEFESQMLSQAAQVVLQARKNGLLSILWIYPRGKAIKNDRDADLIAGAAGVAECLGADFVKVNPPEGKEAEVVKAAGRTKVIFSGGKEVDQDLFLKKLDEQIKIAGASGCAVGRNVHKKTLEKAVEFCKKISKIVHK